MKLIIDIPEELAKKQWYTDKEIWTVIRTVWNGTPIPDNATNGEVLKALFPNERIGHCEDCTDLGDIATFDDDWWNAKYKSESEVSDGDSN